MNEMVTYLLINGFRTYLYQRFLRLFFVREHADKWKEWGGFQVYYVLTSGGYILFSSSGMHVLTNLAGLFLMASVYKGGWRKRGLISILIYSAGIICDAVVVHTIICIWKTDMINMDVMLSFMIQLTVLILLEYAMKFRGPSEYDTPDWPYLLILPVISTGVMYYLAQGGLLSKRSDTKVGVCLIFINTLAFHLYESLGETYRKNMDRQIFKHKSRECANRLECIMETQEQLRSFRHDMKEHLGRLTTVAEKKQNEEMMQYISSMEDLIKPPSQYACSGNAKLDSSLNYLLKKAHKALTSVDTEIKIKDNVENIIYELIVLLDSLMENAIEAAAKTEEKKLFLQMHAFKGILYIVIKYSYNESPRPINGFVKATKTEEYHGDGLKSIRYLVEQNQADMTVDYSENEFYVKVFMYLCNSI